MNKRGALELSITGVVVLIIAIVVLGSVIFFIRNFFGSTTDIIGSQLAGVKDKLNHMENGETVYLEFGKKLVMKKGKPQDIVYGLKNDFTNPDPTKENVCFVSQFVCVNSFSTGKCPLSQVYDTSVKNVGDPDMGCHEAELGPVTVGGLDVNHDAFVKSGYLPTQAACNTNKWVSKMVSFWDIPNQGTDALPVKFQLSGVPADTYQMELRIFTSANNEDCLKIRSATETESINLVKRQTKRFLIELS